MTKNRSPFLIGVISTVGLFVYWFALFIPFAMGANPAHEGLFFKLCFLPVLFVIPNFIASLCKTSKMRKKMQRLAFTIPLAAIPILFWRDILHFAFGTL